MKKLTATLCLTIAVIFIGFGVYWLEGNEKSKAQIGEHKSWKHNNNIISPECFPYEYWSGDNFEAIAAHYSIEYSDDFSKNTGKYFGKEILEFNGIPEPWDGGKYKLHIIRELDTCIYKSDEITFDDGVIIYTDPNPYFGSIYQKRLVKDQNISLKLCQELAPNFKGDCIQSSIFQIGDWSGGSRGFAWRTYIYGIFKTNDHKKYIVPLKSWFGHSRDEALAFYSDWKSDQ